MAAIDQGWRASASRPMLLAVLSLTLAWAFARNGARSPRDAAPGGGGCALPRRRFRDVLWGLYNKVNDDRILAVAGGFAVFGLLALFPGVAAFVALYGLFADWSTINGHLATFTFMLPGGASEIIADEVQRVAAQGN